MKKNPLIFLLAAVSAVSIVASACKTPEPEPEHTHAYTQWKSNDSKHWKECPDDGAKDASSEAAHADANNDEKCDICNYDMHTHTIGTTWSSDATNHWHDASCGIEAHDKDKAAHADANNDEKCDVCNYDMHKHIIGTTWTSDETNHWHDADCNNAAHDTDKAAHVDANNDEKCDTCERDLHKHTYTKWNSDADKHWKECAKDNAKDASTEAAHVDADHNDKCDDCERELTHVHYYARWNYNDDEHWKECAKDGVKNTSTVAPHTGNPGDTCECGYVIPSAGHTHDYTEWKSDENNHWKECPDDHAKDTTTEAPHVNEEGDDELCDVCGYDMHTHTIDTEWSSDETNHWHDADCDNPAHDTDKAPHVDEEGDDELCDVCGYDMHTHTIATEWSKDEYNHWHAASCGNADHDEDREDHIFDNTGVCEECDYDLGYTALELDHEYTASYDDANGGKYYYTVDTAGKYVITYIELGENWDIRCYADGYSVNGLPTPINESGQIVMLNEGGVIVVDASYNHDGVTAGVKFTVSKYVPVGPTNGTGSSSDPYVIAEDGEANIANPDSETTYYFTYTAPAAGKYKVTVSSIIEYSRGDMTLEKLTFTANGEEFTYNSTEDKYPDIRHWVVVEVTEGNLTINIVVSNVQDDLDPAYLNVKIEAYDDSEPDGSKYNPYVKTAAGQYENFERFDYVTITAPAGNGKYEISLLDYEDWSGIVKFYFVYNDTQYGYYESDFDWDTWTATYSVCEGGASLIINGGESVTICIYPEEVDYPITLSIVSLQLAAPQVTLDDNTLRWSPVDHADKYEIYKDGTKVGETEDTVYSIIVSETGTYTYYVVAVSNGTKYLASPASNEVTYDYTAPVTYDLIVDEEKTISDSNPKLIYLEAKTYTIILTGEYADAFKVMEQTNNEAHFKSTQATANGDLIVPGLTSTAVKFTVTTAGAYSLKFIDMSYSSRSCTVKIVEGDEEVPVVPESTELELDTEKEIKMPVGSYAQKTYTFVAPYDGYYKIEIIEGEASNISIYYSDEEDRSPNKEIILEGNPNPGDFPTQYLGAAGFKPVNTSSNTQFKLRFLANTGYVTIKIKITYEGIAGAGDVLTPGEGVVAVEVPWVNSNTTSAPADVASITFEGLEAGYEYILKLDSFNGKTNVLRLIYGDTEYNSETGDIGTFIRFNVKDANVTAAQIYAVGSEPEPSNAVFSLAKDSEYVAPTVVSGKESITATVQIAQFDGYIDFAGLVGLEAGEYELELTDSTIQTWTFIGIQVGGKGGIMTKGESSTVNKIRFTISESKANDTKLCVSVMRPMGNSFTFTFKLYKFADRGPAGLTVGGTYTLSKDAVGDSYPTMVGMMISNASPIPLVGLENGKSYTITITPNGGIPDYSKQFYYVSPDILNKTQISNFSFTFTYTTGMDLYILVPGGGSDSLNGDLTLQLEEA